MRCYGYYESTTVLLSPEDPEKSNSQHSSLFSASDVLFVSSYARLPEPWADTDVFFRAEQTTAVYSLHSDKLLISALTAAC